MLLFFKKMFVQILMVSSRGMLLKSKLISKISVKLLESLTVYLLLVLKIGTKYFAGLYVGVYKEYKIGLIGGQPSTIFLCTLPDPCIIPGLVPIYFRFFCVSLDMLLRSTNFLKILPFFSTGNKI